MAALLPPQVEGESDGSLLMLSPCDSELDSSLTSEP